jgi:hypothetical protein
MGYVLCILIGLYLLWRSIASVRNIDLAPLTDLLVLRESSFFGRRLYVFMYGLMEGWMDVRLSSSWTVGRILFLFRI